MSFVALLRRSAAQARFVLLGGAVVLSLFQFLLIAQAAEIERSQAFGRMAEFVPAFLQRGLGQQALLLATFRGTVSFGYFHPVIVCLLGLIAIYVATEPAHEVESGRVDLVLARAGPRHRLVTRSLVLAVLAVALIAGVMLCGTFLGLRWLAPDASGVPSRLILRLAVNLVAVAWCCGAIGLFLAALFELPRVFKIQNLEDAKHYTGLPVLASVPPLLSHDEKVWLRRSHWLRVAAGIVAAIGAIPRIAMILQATKIFERMVS